MLIDKNTPDLTSYRVRDCTGREIPFVVSYDTESKEITLYLAAEPFKDPESKLHPIIFVPGEQQGTLNPLTVTFTLPSSYAAKDEVKIE